MPFNPALEGSEMPTLPDPIRLGSVEASNRILMAPLTHARNTRDHLPTSIMVGVLCSARQRA